MPPTPLSTTTARVESRNLTDTGTIIVLPGCRGEVVSYSPDGALVTVKWDWVLQMPEDKGSFVPAFMVEVAVGIGTVFGSFA